MKLVTNLLSMMFLVFSLSVKAQSTLDSNIFNKQKSIEEYKQQTEVVLKELEQLKLQKIREKFLIYQPKAIEKEEVVTHSALMLSYNDTHEQANWVMHIVTKDILFGVTGRTNDFRPDPLLKAISADSVDYWDSGYDRGHLAPAADFRWSRNALSESFYYSNMSPQVPEFNRGAWAKLENQVREWALDAEEISVLTGPILKDSLPKVPQGSHRVSIPEAYYKIVLDITAPEYKAIAFIFPNKNLIYDPMKYMVTIDSIEKVTHIDFFPQLDDSLETAMETMKQWSLWQKNPEMPQSVNKIDYNNKNVPTAQAKYFIGAECQICGKVVATRFNMNGKANPTYLNFDKPFPDTPFSVVIFGKDRVNFSYEPEIFLKNKWVCVRGKVGEFNGTPQIVVSEESQFELPPVQE